MRRRLVQATLVALCLGLSALPASAQVFTGRIDVTVKDSTGAVLPGVTVELSGAATANTVTDTRGEARFLNLAPGRYGVIAKLSGFTDYKNDNVPVGAGSVVPLNVTLAVGGVATAVEVRAPETPVIETKRQVVATNVSLDELQNIPTSRDPWVVLQTVPGVVVDRVNVGGAESGQQSNYTAKGAAQGDNTWNIDGIAITDMAALGSSPTYYDFDMFQEMQVTTGGADPANPTPGVQLNFVLKSGTNAWRGSARFYWEDDWMQSENVGSDVTGELLNYNRMEYYRDYGFEVGGPAVKDRLWIWGAYGLTNPATEIYGYQANPGTVFSTDPGCKGDAKPYPFTEGGTYQLIARDCTTLKNLGGKVTGAVSTNMRANFTYFRGDKVKNGRGASGIRPTESTWNQKGPTDLVKGEVSYTMSNNTFLTGRFAYTGGGFSLEPIGGRDVQTYVDDSGVFHGSYLFYNTDRPQLNAQLEGNHFRGGHEFKFGFGWRKSSVESQSGWPGGARTYHDPAYPDFYTLVIRDWAAAGQTSYWNAYVGDQISLNRLTVNLGVRWDYQVSDLHSASVPQNPFCDPTCPAGQANLLPALTGTAQSSVVTYNTLTPRVGLTYALNESRKTIARASYAMFASQLDSTRGYTISQIPGYSYVYYIGRDLNGDRISQPNELLEFDGTFGFNPANPLGGNPDRIGSYGVPKTHELLFGVEHEIMRNLGVSANYTWRKYTDFNWTQYDGVNGEDYTEAGRVIGDREPIGPYNVPFYAVNSASVPSDFARIHETRPGYSQRYWGFELAATKRMSDRWMARVGWSTNDHREYFDGNEAFADPTPGVPSAGTLNGPNKDGGLVMTQSTNSGKTGIYLVLPKYQFIATGAYETKWNVLLGMNYLMRQGYSTPYYQSSVTGSSDDLSGRKTVLLVDDVGEFRLPSVHSFDARVSYALRFNRANVHIDWDIFNLFNSATPLQRVLDVNSASFDQVREIMNPRIFRIGARVTF
jgi:hypothetical protein